MWRPTERELASLGGEPYNIKGSVRVRTKRCFTCRFEDINLFPLLTDVYFTTDETEALAITTDDKH